MSKVYRDYCIKLPTGKWPIYFSNFFEYCVIIARENSWHIDTVITYQLKPHGKLIKTKTQGWYLRWDAEKYHNMFLLRWS